MSVKSARRLADATARNERRFRIAKSSVPHLEQRLHVVERQPSVQRFVDAKYAPRDLKPP